METRILESLREIERSKGIKLLYACETGSRAWGFPSPDSDYDVRFVYRHERDWYLSLGRRSDSIDLPVRDELDVTGWDLRKCLLLLKKSNAALIERFQSPVVYFAEEGFREEFKKLIKIYYSPTAVFYHHFSLAAKFREEMKGARQVKLKSYFYMLRSLLSCNWIIHREEVPPMDIEGLMVVIGEQRREMVRQLIALKATVDEKYSWDVDANLDEWVAALWQLVTESRNDLGVNRVNYAPLDRFFLKNLSNDDHG